MPACTPHSQPASQPDGWAACWGRPAGLKWVQTEGYRDGKAGEPTRHEEHRACGGNQSPQAARPAAPAESRLVATPGDGPGWGQRARS